MNKGLFFTGVGLLLAELFLTLLIILNNVMMDISLAISIITITVAISFTALSIFLIIFGIFQDE